MTYIIKPYKTAHLLLQLLNHDGEGQRKKNFKDNCLAFLFSFFFSVISLLDTVCVSYSTHQKAEKHARKGEIFSVSLFL